MNRVPIDEVTLLGNFEGMEDVLIEALADFERLAPGWLGDVEKAVASDDAALVDRAAHALKGASSNFQATDVMRAAHALESAGRAKDLAKAPELLEELRRQLEILRAYLIALSARLQLKS